MLLQFNGHDAAFSHCRLMRLSVLAAGCWHAEHHFNAAGTLLSFRACFNAAGMMPSLGVAGYRLPVSVAGMVLAFTTTFQCIEPDLLLARNLNAVTQFGRLSPHCCCPSLAEGLHCTAAALIDRCQGIGMIRSSAAFQWRQSSWCEPWYGTFQ